MKQYIFLAFSIIVITFNSNAQSKDNPYAGKTFRIDNYIGDKLDNSEDLVFTNNEVEGSICVQYGFKKAKYTTTINKKGLQEFSCTMISKEHGKMVWTGEKNKNQISGKYLWTKEGQDPIQYTFKGKIK
ncbi:hypothetical protein AWE51_16815 [Aquimarina aggregata]|uniref:Lipocalin-like domain-containing protein n=1 Tax=Aquimarina aggregata TaxID=1642818 RepID=A0A163D581_9FLAO|nr:hypothetical protein [Aquimarina aggregata]KZS43005.1 hypothetical protein AWE51_16815 [Aquimarina aggregata]